VALFSYGYRIFCDRTIAHLLSGVVQVSGIGPVIFLPYINELIAILEKHHIKVKLFADDVKLYRRTINVCDIYCNQHLTL